MAEKLSKDVQAQIDAMTARYTERLAKKAAEGKDLISERMGRVPSDVDDKHRDEYIELRNQLVKLKELRQESVAKLRELKQEMNALRAGGGKRKKRVAKK